MRKIFATMDTAKQTSIDLPSFDCFAIGLAKELQLPPPPPPQKKKQKQKQKTHKLIDRSVHYRIIVRNLTWVRCSRALTAGHCCITKVVEFLSDKSTTSN